MEPPPGGQCPFPNLGKAACAQVRERDSASNAQRITNTYTCSFKTRQSHRSQQWPACTCVWAEGKRDPLGTQWPTMFAAAEGKCHLCSPRRPQLPLTRGEDEGAGGTLHCCHGAGSCLLNSSRPCSSSTGQGQISMGPPGWQGVGGRAFPNPNKWDQKKSNVDGDGQHVQVGHCWVSVSWGEVWRGGGREGR